MPMVHKGHIFKLRTEEAFYRGGETSPKKLKKVQLHTEIQPWVSFNSIILELNTTGFVFGFFVSKPFQ